VSEAEVGTCEACGWQAPLLHRFSVFVDGTSDCAGAKLCRACGWWGHDEHAVYNVLALEEKTALQLKLAARIRARRLPPDTAPLADCLELIPPAEAAIEAALERA
jgi:hypothetical protein